MWNQNTVEKWNEMKSEYLREMKTGENETRIKETSTTII